jgi:hypothetical protein
VVGAIIQLGNCFDLMDTKFTDELPFAFEMLKKLHEHTEHDSVRCGFVEGPPAFDGSGIHHQSHVQLAVRNTACVVGVFRPR